MWNTGIIHLLHHHRVLTPLKQPGHAIDTAGSTFVHHSKFLPGLCVFKPIFLLSQCMTFGHILRNRIVSAIPTRNSQSANISCSLEFPNKLIPNEIIVVHTIVTITSTTNTTIISITFFMIYMF
jgi:hypothetical protein